MPRASARALVLVTVALAASVVVPALADSPDDAGVDATWGEQGFAYALTHEGNGQFQQLSAPAVGMVQPDGKVVMVAQAPTKARRTTGQGDNTELTLEAVPVRFDAAGAPDTAWRGKSAHTPEPDLNPLGVGEALGSSTPFGEGLEALAVTTLPGGDVQVALAADDPESGQQDDRAEGPDVEDLVLARYAGSGASAGQLAAPLIPVVLPGCDRARAAAFLPDGSLRVVTGRCGSDSAGMTAHTVSVDGAVTSTVPVDAVPGSQLYPTAMALASDGRAYVAAEVEVLQPARDVPDPRAALVALTPDNALDTTFDGGAVTRSDRIGAIGVTSDGQLEATAIDENAVHLLRFTSAGVPDPAFGSAGAVSIPVAARTAGSALALDGADRTYVVGRSPDSDTAIAVARVLDDGTLDASFGTAGVRVYDAGTAELDAAAGVVALTRPNGQLVLGVRYAVPSDGPPPRVAPGAGRSSVAVTRLVGTTPAPAPTPTPTPTPEPTVTPAPTATPAPVTGTGTETGTGSGTATTTTPLLPTTTKCVSRRKFTIRLRPKRVKIVSAIVRVNGKRVAVRKGSRITAPVDLRGLPFGRFTVTIEARKADGTRYTETRRYKTCGQKPGKNPGKVKVTKPKQG